MGEIMGKYLSIGKVSKLKNVSIKSLRYYDEIGVFVPSYVNRSTNYRYYTEDQLPMLDVISTCIELGIPLKSLENYVTNHVFDTDRLIADCRRLADDKIRGIYASMDALRQAALALSIPVNASDELATVTRDCRERTVLVSPYAKDENLNQKILRLLMLSQLLGIDASYPSGIIHDYRNGAYQRLVYITVNDRCGCLDPRIQTIPAGRYDILTEKEHLDYHPVPSSDSVSLILETDIMDETMKKEGNLYEVQSLL